MSRTEDIGVWIADHDDRAAHYSIRHRVFVLEQRVMELTDIDIHDLSPGTVHVLAAHGRRTVGAVRLYPLQDGLWQGDRLAVLPSHRSSMVGAELVRFAVATAAARGGSSMTAQIQLPNVRFFERLGWVRAGEPAPYCGLEHQAMCFDLGRAPGVTMRGRPVGLEVGPALEARTG
ncbi:hypothetical protein GCM10027062_22560 [Nocardioides hungaricus]